MNGLHVCQNPKNFILGTFWDFLDPPDPSRFFFKNQTSVLFLLYNYITLRKKFEKTDVPILRFCIANGQIEPHSASKGVEKQPEGKIKKN